MALTELILVRHGQSEGNVAAEAALRDDLERIDVPVRDPDIELSELGRRQAAAVGTWLAKQPADDQPDVTWTSPYRRARQTGQIALDEASLELPVLVDERLRDRDMVSTLARACGLALTRRVAMPANNLMLLFRRDV